MAWRLGSGRVGAGPGPPIGPLGPGKGQLAPMT